MLVWSPRVTAPRIERLKALAELEVLDTLPEQAYDDIVKIAAQICGVPIALVSLVDEKRQWFKAKLGLEAEQTPRELPSAAMQFVILVKSSWLAMPAKTNGFRTTRLYWVIQMFDSMPVHRLLHRKGTLWVPCALSITNPTRCPLISWNR